MIQFTTRLAARRTACGLFCAVGLLFLAGCETPVSVERVDARTAHRALTANVLTADELSDSTHNVLRRWVLSEGSSGDAILISCICSIDGRLLPIALGRGNLLLCPQASTLRSYGSR